MKKIPKSRLRKIRTWSLGSRTAELESFGNPHKELRLIDLASNDYLGLSRHPSLIQAAETVMKSQGVGAGASRFITGSRPIHKELEEALCNWLGREHVSLFPSGFQANLAAVIALADRKTLVLADKYIHHSLLIGITASGAKTKRFAHNDIEGLEKLLINSRKKRPDQKILVITESLFSMEGSSPDLKKVTNLCTKYEAKLFVDEAHAIGVMGSKGRGLCYGISDPIKMISGTFGKAFGSGGAFLATNKTIGNELIQSSGAFRYTTALAPPLAAAATAALNLIKQNPEWGAELEEESKIWRSKLKGIGWDTPPGNGPILSILIGSDEEALLQQKILEENGLLSVAIRPPTVPEGTARLRLVVRRDLPGNTLTKLMQSMSKK